jgi:Heparinase II/III-like protein/Heparinase II/III N-terminus
MGLPEIFYRITQKAQAITESCGLGLAKSPPEPAGRSGHPWTESMPVNFGANKDCYIARGDRILEGKFQVFAISDAKLGFPPNWQRDPKTGTEAPLRFGKTLDYRSEAIVGDIKYLWEPNRHLELVSLAQAWHLSSKQRFLEGARALLNSWFDQNPYPLGVNWTSSLEHAIRLMNWSFAWHLFGGMKSPLFDGAVGVNFRRRWLDSIYQHCFFIAGHFSKYSSANNHLLGEYAGLFIATITWPLWQDSDHWLETAKRGLEGEALTQNAVDGGNKEQGIWYHHEVADMLLLCVLFGRANGIELSSEYWVRLEAMLEFIASLMNVSGQLPMIGDSDDAVIVDLSTSRNVYHSLLATGSVLYQRGDFKIKSQRYDDKTRWLLGDEAEKQFHDISLNQQKLPIHRAFSDSGYYILGDAFELTDEIRMIADAGPLGYLSIAAHGHADALSVTLSVAGFEILIDPGTYAYHTNQMWRNYFKGTSAHNTVRVDQVDQSLSGGNFLWLKHANSECLDFRIEESEEVWVAQHDGYSRLRDPVIHRRSIRFDRTERCFYFIDSLQCREKHEVEIHWHCSEQCVLLVKEDIVQIRVEDVLVEIKMPDTIWQPDVIHGRMDPPLGWISRSFDSKVQSPTIRWKGTIEGATHLATQIKILRIED